MKKKSRFAISARTWGVIVAVLILIVAGTAMEIFMGYTDRVVRHYDDEGSYTEIIEPADE